MRRIPGDGPGYSVEWMSPMSYKKLSRAQLASSGVVEVVPEPMIRICLASFCFRGVLATPCRLEELEDEY